MVKIHNGMSVQDLSLFIAFHNMHYHLFMKVWEEYLKIVWTINYVDKTQFCLPGERIRNVGLCCNAMSYILIYGLEDVYWQCRNNLVPDIIQ